MKDLTGQRFGRLVARNRTGKKKGTSLEWACQCDCGKMVYVASNNLVNGTTRSCGCLRNETAAKLGQMHTIDQTGQRFGRLVALRPTKERKGGFVVWECVCDCGNTAYVAGSKLKNGNTKSCGCLRKESAAKGAEKSIVDLTGQRFGRLVALRPTKERKGGFVVWECRCDCGNTALVKSGMLTCGNTSSCGCLRKETAAKNIMKTRSHAQVRALLTFCCTPNNGKA